MSTDGFASPWRCRICNHRVARHRVGIGCTVVSCDCPEEHRTSRPPEIETDRMLRDLVAAARLVPRKRLSYEPVLGNPKAGGRLAVRCVGCGARDADECRPGCWVAFFEGRVEDTLRALGDADGLVDFRRSTRKGGALVEPRPSEREREEASNDAERGRDSSAPGGGR